MTRPLIAALTLVALVGCGADGAPERPTDDDRIEPGVTISGTVSVGVSGGHERIKLN